MPIHVIKSRRGKLKKIRRLAPDFLQKYLPIVARNPAGAPDCMYYIIYQYTAGTAHLTNHDTRHIPNNSRHIKEPGKMSHTRHPHIHPFHGLTVTESILWRLFSHGTRSV